MVVVWGYKFTLQNSSLLFTWLACWFFLESLDSAVMEKKTELNDNFIFPIRRVIIIISHHSDFIFPIYPIALTFSFSWSLTTLSDSLNLLWKQLQAFELTSFGCNALYLVLFATWHSILSFSKKVWMQSEDRCMSSHVLKNIITTTLANSEIEYMQLYLYIYLAGAPRLQDFRCRQGDCK